MRTDNRTTFSVTASCAAIAIMCSASVQGQTTFNATANGPNGSNDSWNLAGNWSAGLPSGTDAAIIDTGLFADVWYDGSPDTPPGGTQSYSGGLTLNANSSVQIGWTTFHASNINALGTGPITMHDGSQIRLRHAATVDLDQGITLAGDASLHLSPSTSAHHQTRNIGTAINGPYTFTVIGNNNNLLNFDTTNTFSELILDADDRYRVAANATGSLGTGDVTVNPRTNADNRSAVLIINALDAMDDFATLTLDGTGYNGTSPFGTTLLQMNADDTIGAFFIGGVDQGVGMFDSSTHPGVIAGSGTLSVTGITEQVVPEPASVAIWSLIGLGVAGFGMYRARKKR